VRTLAILPVKRFELAKQRLSAELPAEFRRELAEAMVGDVLDALAACASLEDTLVITGEPRVAALAREHQALVGEDPHAAGQSAAALVAIAFAVRGGFERALLVPGDCPALDPEELEQLLAEPGAERSVVIVPDRHGTGTNALLLTPPDALVPAFGPGSCRRHRDQAAAVGAECRIAELPSLLLDVDTPGDLAALREALERREGHATRTRTVLAAWPHADA
jgi:2-phospho-L-lactate guanylyltransferase